MRIGLSGQGGVGKSTIAAVLSRTLARQGPPVVAADCDSDPNLGVSIGVGESGADSIRPLLDQSGPRRHVPADLTPAELLDGLRLSRTRQRHRRAGRPIREGGLGLNGQLPRHGP